MSNRISSDEAPDYRQRLNAPSESSENDAFKRGIERGKILGYSDALADIMSVLISMQKKFMDGLK